MSAHHIVYVPGLGDAMPHGQQLVPVFWRLFGVRGHYVPMHWNDKSAFAPKLARLLAKIDELAKDGGRVSLVGTSAGASVVLAAYAARPDEVAGVVCICGKVNRPETVEPWRFAENPAFKDSLTQLQQALPGLSPAARARIMSIHPLYDGVVPARDTIIPGATEKTFPVIGHALAIASILIFGARGMMRFLRRQN